MHGRRAWNGHTITTYTLLWSAARHYWYDGWWVEPSASRFPLCVTIMFDVSSGYWLGIEPQVACRLEESGDKFPARD